MIQYQFSLLRYQHSASSGECVNIGVIMWLPETNRLLYAINERYARLSTFFRDGFQGTSYRQMIRHLSSRLERVARDISGEVQRSLLEALPTEFGQIQRVIVPGADSVFQWSMTMAGVTADPDRRLTELMREFVERHEDLSDAPKREDADVWASVERVLTNRRLFGTGRVAANVEIRTPDYSYKFHAGWQNGVSQVIEPITFDLVHPSAIVEKATHWSGRLLTLSRAAEFQMTAVVAPPEREDNREAFERARAILEKAPNMRRVVTESAIDEFAPEIERDFERRGR